MTMTPTRVKTFALALLVALSCGFESITVPGQRTFPFCPNQSTNWNASARPISSMASPFFSSPRTHTLALRQSQQESEFSDEELRKMDELILALSRESVDSERRDKVAQVLGEKLIQPNGHGSSDRFLRLFEERLNIVGNSVRDQAAAEVQQDQNNKNNNTVEEPGQPSEQVGKQLWALVDILIQSKIIFKQAKKDGLV